MPRVRNTSASASRSRRAACIHPSTAPPTTPVMLEREYVELLGVLRRRRPTPTGGALSHGEGLGGAGAADSERRCGRRRDGCRRGRARSPRSTWLGRSCCRRHPDAGGVSDRALSARHRAGVPRVLLRAPHAPHHLAARAPAPRQRRGRARSTCSRASAIPPPTRRRAQRCSRASGRRGRRLLRRRHRQQHDSLPTSARRSPARFAGTDLSGMRPAGLVGAGRRDDVGRRRPSRRSRTGGVRTRGHRRDRRRARATRAACCSSSPKPERARAFSRARRRRRCRRQVANELQHAASRDRAPTRPARSRSPAIARSSRGAGGAAPRAPARERHVRRKRPRVEGDAEAGDDGADRSVERQQRRVGGAAKHGDAAAPDLAAVARSIIGADAIAASARSSAAMRSRGKAPMKCSVRCSLASATGFARAATPCLALVGQAGAHAPDPARGR